MHNEKAEEILSQYGWHIEKAGEFKRILVFDNGKSGISIFVPYLFNIGAEVITALKPHADTVVTVDGKDTKPCRDVIEALQKEMRRELYEAQMEDRRLTLQWVNYLRTLIEQNPHLPVVFAGSIGIGSGIDWMDGFADVDVLNPSVETIAYGKNGHIIIKGQTEPDDYDPKDLEWYEAVVVRVV